MRDTFRNGDIPYPAGTFTSTAWPDMTTLSVRASFSRAYVFPSDPMGLMNSNLRLFQGFRRHLYAEHVIIRRGLVAHHFLQVTGKGCDAFRVFDDRQSRKFLE